MNKLVQVVALLAALLVSEASAAITCEQVCSNLVPCLLYTTGRGTLTLRCCNGVLLLNCAASTSADRQVACVGASRALPVPSAVSTWVPSPTSPASAVSPCPSHQPIHGLRQVSCHHLFKVPCMCRHTYYYISPLLNTEHMFACLLGSLLGCMQDRLDQQSIQLHINEMGRGCYLSFASSRN
jgi:hypothetical protein